MLSEWHITPDYIVLHWTDELFNLMCERLVERKKRESDAMQGKRTVSIETLADLSHGSIKVEKSGD